MVFLCNTNYHFQPPVIRDFLPKYHVLYRMLRKTLHPSGGDANRVNNYSRNLLKWVGESQKFNVFDFIYHDIYNISYTPIRSCGYSPYIMFMIEHVSGKRFAKDVPHKKLQP